jgi:hypothetical protein
MKFFKNKLVRRVFIILAALTIFLTGTIVAGAGTLFDDVDDTAIYRDAVEWLVNRAITLGCGGNNYCPNNRVTRAQMAMFMQRLGTALTPTYMQADSGYTSLDPDAGPIVCETSGHTVSDYPQQAIFNVDISIQAAEAMGFYISPVASTDGGMTYNYIGFSGNFHRGSASAAGEWVSVSTIDWMLLDPTTTYNFAIEVGRVAGTLDATDYRCDIIVTIENRNGTSSPFAVTAEGSTDENP